MASSSSSADTTGSGRKRKMVSFADSMMTVDEGRALSDSQAIKLSRRGPQEDDETLRDRQDVDTGDIDAADTKSDYHSKHTLESDEEEDEKYERLNPDNIEGQEDDTEEYSGDTKITPFNMKEEMEEGHFDSTGNFIFKKGAGGDIKDAWLDNIDWAKVKKDAGGQWHKYADEEENASDDDDDSKKTADKDERMNVYEQLLVLMKPGESATKTLRRLGGKPKDAAAARKERWKAKKAATTTADAATSTSADDDGKASMLAVTGLVDRLVSQGNFEAYGLTYERIKFELDKMKNVKLFATTAEQTASAGTTQKLDAELDMFAETIDENRLKDGDTSTVSTKAESASTNESDVEWEFRWTNEPTAELHGPCSTAQMIKWQQEEYFKDGVWVRRINANATDAPFYSSKRMDFELYA